MAAVELINEKPLFAFLGRAQSGIALENSLFHRPAFSYELIYIISRFLYEIQEIKGNSCKKSLPNGGFFYCLPPLQANRRAENDDDGSSKTCAK